MKRSTRLAVVHTLPEAPSDELRTMELPTGGVYDLFARLQSWPNIEWVGLGNKLRCDWGYNVAGMQATLDESELVLWYCGPLTEVAPADIGWALAKGIPVWAIGEPSPNPSSSIRWFSDVDSCVRALEMQEG
jgi:hypothetical protein